MSQSSNKIQLKEVYSAYMIKKGFILIITAVVVTCLSYHFFTKKTEESGKQLTALTEVGKTDLEDIATIKKQEHNNNASHKKNRVKNVAPATMRNENIDTDEIDPTIIKRLLIKKGIYFGDYLGNEDVRLQAPRPKNFLIEVNKYFNLYSIPAWFNHIEDKQGVYDFKAVDEVADFAVAHGAKIQAHNLVWHYAIPDWLSKGHFTPDELSVILKNHIQAVMRHFKEKYPGVVIAWDVVNEEMGDFPNNPKLCFTNGLRKNIPIWNVIHKPGSNDPLDYIRLAFQWAHEADPTAKLYWNDFNVEYKSFKMDNWFNIIKQLKDEGIPIDGVGFQTHLTLAYDHPFSELTENMDRFASIGLTSQVTEMDVIMSSTSRLNPPYKVTLVQNLTPADYEKQAQMYRGVISACIKAKKCNALILFGEWDPGSYANTAFKDIFGRSLGLFHPNILDDNMRQKPAFREMVNEAKALIPN